MHVQTGRASVVESRGSSSPRDPLTYKSNIINISKNQKINATLCFRAQARVPPLKSLSFYLTKADWKFLVIL